MPKQLVYSSARALSLSLTHARTRSSCTPPLRCAVVWRISHCSHKPYILLAQRALPSMKSEERSDWLRNASLQHKTRGSSLNFRSTAIEPHTEHLSPYRTAIFTALASTFWTPAFWDYTKLTHCFISPPSCFWGQQRPCDAIPLKRQEFRNACDAGNTLHLDKLFPVPYLQHGSLSTTVCPPVGMGLSVLWILCRA